jgi:hypothetical protein
MITSAGIFVIITIVSQQKLSTDEVLGIRCEQQLFIE